MSLEIPIKHVKIKSNKQLEELLNMYLEKVIRIDEQITEMEREYPKITDYPSDDYSYLVEKCCRIHDKALLVHEELEYRKVHGIIKEVHSTDIFIDNTVVTATLTGTVDFTEGSDTVYGTGTLFTTELAVGDYIRPAGGVEWYRVGTIVSDTELTLSWAFKQTSVTGVSVEKNAEDGLSPTTAFCHLRQATIDTIRSPGDRILCRRGQTQTYAGVEIGFDESGTADAPIILGSDDGTGWPGEEGLSKTLLDFANTYSWPRLVYDHYWTIKDLGSRGSRQGGWDVYGDVVGNLFDGVEFFETRRAVSIRSHSIATIRNSILRNSTDGIYLDRSIVTVEDSRIYGNTLGLNMGSASKAYLKNSVFGDPTENTSRDLNIGRRQSWIIGRNVVLASSVEVGIGDYPENREGYIRIEDKDGIKLANKVWTFVGTITSDTTVVRPDGSTSSGRMEPNDKCIPDRPLKLCLTEELSRWLKAGIHGCGMWVRGSAWSTIPTSDELYLEVKYYDSESAKRATVKSTQTLQTATVTGETVGTGDGTTTEFFLANRCLQAYTETIYVDGTLQTRDTDYSIDYDTGKITFTTAPALDTTITADYTYFKWTQLSVSFDLYSDSPCYANIILKKYESGAKVYVDILPVWS